MLKPFDTTLDVVIPTFGRDHLTKEAVESLLSQEVAPNERLQIFIYVVEDGDHAFSQYAKEVGFCPPQMTILNTGRNSGPSAARNLGAAQGVAEYLSFLDSDDLWAPQKAALQIRLLQQDAPADTPNADVKKLRWCHTNEEWRRDGVIVKQKKIHRKRGGLYVDQLMERCLISPSAVMFQRSFFEDKGWFAPHFRVAEDYELWIRLNLTEPIGYLDQPLTIKRAGKWPQISATLEIDRQRVLALHRFYRLNKKNPHFAPIHEKWRGEILKKIGFLIQGAKKYNNPKRLAQYQSWEYLFKMERTSE